MTERGKTSDPHMWTFEKKRNGERGGIVIHYPILDRNFSFGAVSN